MGDGRVLLCLISGALMAQPTLLKLKTSTDWCPVDLGEVFSSRAEFLVLNAEMCKATA